MECRSPSEGNTLSTVSWGKQLKSRFFVGTEVSEANRVISEQPIQRALPTPENMVEEPLSVSTHQTEEEEKTEKKKRSR